MRPFLLIPLLSALAIQSAAAQRVPCPYDECALRVEGREILAGAAGRRVARFNMIGSADLSALVSGDSATFYALRFEQKQNSGGALSVIGGLMVLGGTLWMLAGDSNDELFDISTGGFWLSVGGSVVGFAGSMQINQARKALSRAIWWNNRDLTH